MKLFSSLLVMVLISCCANGRDIKYMGATPAHKDVRSFLNISQIDSIDFIKWKLSLSDDHYELDCRYGISKPNTNGFLNEKTVHLSGQLVRQMHQLELRNGEHRFYLLEINKNLLHLLDRNKSMLVGNGGFSYTLNNESPVKSNAINISSQEISFKTITAFEGRTPCQELSQLLGLNKSTECDKMKWFIVFFADSVTGKPLYYLKGGMGHRISTMDRGNWSVVKEKGRIIYKLNPEKQSRATYLLQADNNILLFTDAEGNLLVGNENFSYTLNRMKDPRLKD